MASKPRTVDEQAWQLIGLAWAGVDARDDRIQAAARSLLAEQRADGGWAQLPALASDAYATGQVLVALRQVGAIRPTAMADRRAVRYLLDSQLADGTWYVRTRAVPFQPYFESGFPFGPDQWVSAAAGNWAAMALAGAVAIDERQSGGPATVQAERRR
jgi:squalene cyclase